MIIDCHVHLTADALSIDVMHTATRLGIQRLCVSSLGRVWNYEPRPDVFIEANNDVSAAMRCYPDKVLGFCYVNPMYPDESMHEFRRCTEDLGMSGLKLWVAAYADHHLVFPLVEQAIQYGVPVLQHAWHKVTGNLPHESGPSHVAALGRRYPEACLIMAHMAGDWEYGIQAIKDVPNVVVDTSGTIMDMGMVERAVEELGPKRVLFGSDAEGVDIAAALGKVLDADIPEPARLLVLGGNMDALLHQHSDNRTDNLR